MSFLSDSLRKGIGYWIRDINKATAILYLYLLEANGAFILVLKIINLAKTKFSRPEITPHKYPKTA